MMTETLFLWKLLWIIFLVYLILDIWFRFIINIENSRHNSLVQDVDDPSGDAKPARDKVYHDKIQIMLSPPESLHLVTMTTDNE